MIAAAQAFARFRTESWRHGYMGVKLVVPNLISNEDKMKRTKIDDGRRGKCNAHQFSGKTYFSLHVFAFICKRSENVRAISIHRLLVFFPFFLFESCFSQVILLSVSKNGVV